MRSRRIRNNNGSTITLAKLNGNVNKTEMATVKSAANVIGAKTKSESLMLLRTTRSKMVILTTAISAAFKKAFITVRDDS